MGACMFHVVLYQPEIPPNTGNIIRLCANTGSVLHLVGPLGFDLDDRKLRRAGLDYREWATLREHESLAAFQAAVQPARLWALSTKGARSFAQVSYQEGDAFLFGPETRGLPHEVLQYGWRGCGTALADGCQQPQPESVEYRGGGYLRGLAATGI